MKAESMPTFRYTVTHVSGSEPAVATVNACYMQEEGSLVLFKDGNHAVVFAVSAGMLLSVAREGLMQ